MDIQGAGDGVHVRVTAYAYRQPSATNATSPGDGLEWASADVQMCVQALPAGVTLSVTARPWRLAYPDGRSAERSSTTYQQFPNPAYPDDERVVPVGRCARGWITFPVPKGQRPTWVEYAPATGSVTDWTI